MLNIREDVHLVNNSLESYFTLWEALLAPESLFLDVSQT